MEIIKEIIKFVLGVSLSILAAIGLGVTCFSVFELEHLSVGLIIGAAAVLFVSWIDIELEE